MPGEHLRTVLFGYFRLVCREGWGSLPYYIRALVPPCRYLRTDWESCWKPIRAAWDGVAVESPEAAGVRFEGGFIIEAEHGTSNFDKVCPKFVCVQFSRISEV